jgi:hypothetical protein
MASNTCQNTFGRKPRSSQVSDGGGLMEFRTELINCGLGFIIGVLIVIVAFAFIGLPPKPEPKEITVNLESMDQLSLNYLIKEAEEQGRELEMMGIQIQELKTEIVKLRKELQ